MRHLHFSTRPSSAWRIISLVVVLMSAYGCAPAPTRPSEPIAAPPVVAAETTPSPQTRANDPTSTRQTTQTPLPAPTEPENLWGRIRSGMALPEGHDARIQNELETYSARAVETILARAEPYLYLIVAEIQQRGLPMEIALLPAVESGFDPLAYSSGRAAGLWQFIPSTGAHLGLKQSWWYDGRRDVVMSTRAALDYLEYLVQRFDGDWLLALAAYNAGEGTVSRMMKRQQERGRATDYWSLPLYEETRRYVPRLLAFREMVSRPDEFGIELPDIANKAKVDTVNTDGQIDLALAAEISGVPLEEIYTFNPGLNRWATDPAGPHHLLLPIDSSEKLADGLKELRPDQRISWKRHHVRAGDTLSQLAKRHRTTVAVIQEINDLSGSRIRVGDYLLLPTPAKRGHPHTERDQALAARQGNTPSQKTVNYTVRSGDSLWQIARRHGVTTEALTRWNNLDPQTIIQPGQSLKILSYAPLAQSPTNRKHLQTIRYRVRKGDSLYRIANRFNVTVKDLRAWNNLQQRYLYPGQKLVIHIDVVAQSGS